MKQDRCWFSWFRVRLVVLDLLVQGSAGSGFSCFWVLLVLLVLLVQVLLCQGSAGSPSLTLITFPDPEVSGCSCWMLTCGQMLDMNLEQLQELQIQIQVPDPDTGSRFTSGLGFSISEPRPCCWATSPEPAHPVFRNVPVAILDHIHVPTWRPDSVELRLVHSWKVPGSQLEGPRFTAGRVPVHTWRLAVHMPPCSLL